MPPVVDLTDERNWISVEDAADLSIGHMIDYIRWKRDRKIKDGQPTSQVPRTTELGKAAHSQTAVKSTAKSLFRPVDDFPRDNCAICKEPLLNLEYARNGKLVRVLNDSDISVRMKCGHMYHEHCVESYIQHGKAKRYAVFCPLCRRETIQDKRQYLRYESFDKDVMIVCESFNKNTSTH